MSERNQSTDIIGDDAGGSERDDGATATRSAMVSSAIGGIQRFKQSYISIMILKAGIGLGQVIALITLLILASTLPSPLYPSQKQSTPSQACPHPHLFQAWCITNLMRLTICWSVSVWMLIRDERSRRLRAAIEREREEMEHQAALERQRAAREVAASRVRSSDRGNSVVIRSRSSLLESLASSGNIPSLASTSTGGSTCSLSPSPSSAQITPSPTITDIYSIRVASGSASPLDTSCTSSPTMTPGSETNEKMPSSVAINDVYHRYSEYLLESDEGMENIVVGEAEEEEERNNPGDAGQISDLPQSQDLAERIISPASPPLLRMEIAAATGFPGWMDRHALKISQSLGLISLILWILGNILLMYPFPKSDTSCYAAAPMLWWGVMTVTGVGWVLFIQVFVVVVIVGLGGHVVLEGLRKIGISSTPTPETSPARTARPDPLTIDEVEKLKIVCYLPSPPSPTIQALSLISSSKLSSPMLEQNDLPEKPTLEKNGEESIPQFDLSRIPYPPVYLEEDKALCAICQENFIPPRDDGRKIMLSVEALRLLGCGHVFHKQCIDQWLLESYGNCPFCNRSIRETTLLPPSSALPPSTSSTSSNLTLTNPVISNPPSSVNHSMPPATVPRRFMTFHRSRPPAVINPV